MKLFDKEITLKKKWLGRIFLIVLFIAGAYGGYLQLFYYDISIFYWLILILWQVVFFLIKEYIDKLEKKQ